VGRCFCCGKSYPVPMNPGRLGRQMSGADLYTCYKEIDWVPMADYTSPSRKLKNAGKFTSDSSGRFVLTTEGEKHFSTLKVK